MPKTKRYQIATEAIDKLFADTSVPPSETKALLEEIAEDIAIKIESLSLMIDDDDAVE